MMIKIIVRSRPSPVQERYKGFFLPLLWKLFDEVLIPETVYRELCSFAKT